MYIEPNTTIVFMNDVPLDPNYDNTVLYDSAESQFANMILKRKMTFERNSYQRVNRGYIRVNTCADNLYDCNYLAFKNTNYGNKWFYAFVTSVEFLNNETCEVRFEIDVLQTYMFDYNLGQCFIERQHTETDEIGDNIIPEVLSTGDMTISKLQPLSQDLTDLVVVINIMYRDTYADRGRLLDGVYSGTCLFAFEKSDIAGINNQVALYDIFPDKLINMYMCPRVFLNNALPAGRIPEGGIRIYNTTSGHYVKITKDSNGNSFAINKTTDNFDGYLPKNNKLYTYPYNYFCVSTPNGDEMALRYEFFNTEPKLWLTCNAITPAEAVLRPLGYKGSPYDGSAIGRQLPFMGDGLTLNNFPFCSWQSDAFVAWLVHSALPTALSGATNLAMSAQIPNDFHTKNVVQDRVVKAKNPETGRMVQKAKIHTETDTTSNYYNYANQRAMAHTVAESLGAGAGAMLNGAYLHGNVSSGNNNVANGLHTFYTYRAHCTKDFAQMIDNYFTVFGYAINKIGVPNISARPHYTYIKTMNCQAEGRMPADDLARIRNIFDNGITFWRYMDEVGNYSVDNSPISTQMEE